MQTTTTMAPASPQRSHRSTRTRAAQGRVSRSMPRTIVDHHTPPSWDRPRGALDWNDSWDDSGRPVAAREGGDVVPSAWPAHLLTYRAEEWEMREDEMDRMAEQIGGPPEAATMIERAVDRLALVLAGSFGTRSWSA